MPTADSERRDCRLRLEDDAEDDADDDLDPERGMAQDLNALMPQGPESPGEGNRHRHPQGRPGCLGWVRGCHFNVLPSVAPPYLAALPGASVGGAHAAWGGRSAHAGDGLPCSRGVVLLVDAGAHLHLHA